MLTDNGNSNGMVMPVSPMYGNGGNGMFGGGGDFLAWIILFLLIGCGNNGFGGGGFGGNGNEFAWLMNGQQGINANTNNGFRDAMINDGITGIRGDIGNISTQLCNGFANVEQGANARQMSIMQGFNNNLMATNDVKYTIATEACNTRNTDTQNTQVLLNAFNSGFQSIKDQLCNDKIDAKNDEIAQLRQQLNMQNLTATYNAQSALIQQGFANEVDALYNRLNSCPVPTTPVYGRTPIFTCQNNEPSCCNCNGR